MKDNNNKDKLNTEEKKDTAINLRARLKEKAKNKKKQEKEKDSNKTGAVKGLLKKNWKTIAGIGLALCVGIAIGKVSMPKKNWVDPEKTVKVKGAEKKEAIEEIQSLITNIKENNGYLKVVEGEDLTTTYVYNKKGEAVAQGSLGNYLTVFTNDKKGVRYTDTVEKGDDIDILSINERVLQLAKENKLELTKPETIVEGDTKGFKVYSVELNGWEDIRKVYEVVSKEFADTMITNMKEQAKDVSDIKMEIQFILGNENQLSVACRSTMNGQKYMIWYFDGYLLLYDWELDEDWYTDDFSDITEAENKLNKLLTSLDDMFKRYAEDNNLDEAGEETTESSQGEEVSQGDEKSQPVAENTEQSADSTETSN